jgi:hypothetical protein
MEASSFIACAARGRTRPVAGFARDIESRPSLTAPRGPTIVAGRLVATRERAAFVHVDRDATAVENVEPRLSFHRVDTRRVTRIGEAWA